MGRPRLRFATDCSGCDAAAFALRSTTFCKQHRIRLRHRWASDINPIARQFILNNHKPRRIYDDCSERDNSELNLTKKPVHCLVLGFPCQPFSALGIRKGWRDKRKSKPYKAFTDLLRQYPGCIKSVLLENVKGFANHDGGKSMNRVLRDLAGLGFKVTWRMYSSSEFGLPQRRQRVYPMVFGPSRHPPGAVVQKTWCM